MIITELERTRFNDLVNKGKIALLYNEKGIFTVTHIDEHLNYVCFFAGVKKKNCNKIIIPKCRIVWGLLKKQVGI